MNIYLTTRKRSAQGYSIPTFEVTTICPPPSDNYRIRTVVLAPGDYVVAAKCEFIDDLHEIRTDVYRVSNDDGEIKEELIDSYGLEKFD